MFGYAVDLLQCRGQTLQGPVVLPAGNPDEVYFEVVRGFGETLVGNHPGSALNCVAAKANLRSSGDNKAPSADSVADDAVRCVIGTNHVSNLWLQFGELCLSYMQMLISSSSQWAGHNLRIINRSQHS